MDYTDGEPEYGGVNRESQVSLKFFCVGGSGNICWMENGLWFTIYGKVWYVFGRELFCGRKFISHA